MSRKTIVLAALALLIAGSTVLAQSGGDFELKRSVVAGGGGTSSGGDFVLAGSTGQVDAGRLSGGDFVLAGGFWSEVEAIDSPTPTSTATPTQTPTATTTPTSTASLTQTPTATSSPTATATPTGTAGYSVFLPVILRDYPGGW